MEIILILGCIGIYVLIVWLISKITMPISNLISLTLIGETLTLITYLNNTSESDIMEVLNKKEIREQLKDIKNIVENDIHPTVSPNNWYIYSNVHNEIEQLEILLKRNDAT